MTSICKKLILNSTATCILKTTISALLDFYLTYFKPKQIDNETDVRNLKAVVKNPNKLKPKQ